MKYFDAHAHLQLHEYNADRAAVLARMEAVEAGAIIVGVDKETSNAAVALAEQYDFLWAAVGLHPNDKPTEEFDDATFAQLALNPKVIAIGECGLDYYRNEPTLGERARQKKRFERHIALALAAHKPLIIHCRPTKGTENAHEEMLSLLAPHMLAPAGERLRAVIHFFTSTAEVAQHYVALGCYLSFPGPVTYTDIYDASIAAAPLDRILTETDSPFAAPVPHRGQRNEPSYVEEVVKKIARVKEVPLQDVLQQIVNNAREIFALA